MPAYESSDQEIVDAIQPEYHRARIARITKKLAPVAKALGHKDWPETTENSHD